MLWILFSFLSAISEATKNLLAKLTLQKIDEYAVAWSLRFFALIFLLPLLLFIPIPHVDKSFYLALFIGGSIDSVASILFMKAIKISPLSLAAPLVAFTPIFIVLTAPFIVGEYPSKIGLIGILLTVLGAYLLNIIESRKGILEPIRALFREKGCLLMLVVALLWGISSNIDKIGVLHSSPIFWVIAFTSFLSLVLFVPMLMHKPGGKINQFYPNIKILILIGLLSSLELFFQMSALRTANVAYVISIKFTSIILSVLLGYWILKETKIKERLLGAIIMVSGLLFITLFGN